ncbi:MAG: DUF5063 domain-containing protein [Fulvivirga sp.]
MLDNLTIIAEDICRWSNSNRQKLPNKINFLQKQLLHLYILERTFHKPSLEAVSDANPPESEYEQIRSGIEKNLPELGFYHKVTNPLDVSNKIETGIGDAVDDLTDIIQDLTEFIWWANNSEEAEAIWHFKQRFKIHTHEHLIGLIYYLGTNNC